MKLKYWIYLIVFFVACIWSGINPYEQTLWYLEAGICLGGATVLILTFKRFRFTDITYTFILIEMIVLFIGAHYSYAREPFFGWLQETLGWERNNFDKVGHFLQGFVPALVARELYVRLNIFQKKGWIPFFVICTSLSISAFYELIEWWSALMFTQSANDFLGTQGYEWDTQSDMFMAFLGACMMLLLLAKTQDKQIEKVRQAIAAQV